MTPSTGKRRSRIDNDRTTRRVEAWGLIRDGGPHRPRAKGGQRIVASRDGQTITISEAGDCEELAIRLDDSMVDLDKPVTVRHAGTTLFEGVVPRSADAMRRTLEERGDPRGVFTAEIEVALPPAKP